MSDPGTVRDALPLALEILRREHAEILDGFDGLRRAASNDARETARLALLATIQRHLDLEERTLYPAMRHIDALRAIYRSGADQHGRMRELMARGFGESQLASLQAAFAQHRDEEESQTFGEISRTMGDQLPALAVEMEEVRAALKGAYGV